MKVIIRHMGIVLAGVLILLGIPFFTTDYCKNLLQGDPDAVTSASVIIAQPSGEYLVFINSTFHTDAENLNTWVDFFDGKEISYLFEDISCSVISADSGALEMARSFQSRLPEKQMTIQTEDATLLASRIDNNKYDIVILSKEFANSYGVGEYFEQDMDSVTMYNNAIVIRIASEGESG
jgi:hypothetical protein